MDWLSKERYNKALMQFLIWRIKYVSDNNFLLLVAGLIGLIAGLAAYTLKTSVHFIQYLLNYNVDITGANYLYLLYPTIGILATSFLANAVFKEKLGHGITQILYAISKKSSLVERSKMYTRMITSAVTVGFGGSVGLEAPIVVTGSAIGSNVGQLVHLDYKKRTLLIGCGAAGAISAIFNSPIAGVIFAIEVILTDITISKFIPILIASVMGQLVTLVLLGDDILFSFDLTTSFTANQTFLYLGLGGICGLSSLYFTRAVYFTENRIKNVKRVYLRALLGGIGLAVIIIIFPPIYGEGYNSILELLKGNVAYLFQRTFFFSQSGIPLVIIAFCFFVILIKPIATALTIGSGGSGGIFGPSLFMGGITGFLYGYIVIQIYPEAPVDLSAFTLVGMSGVMSGVLHAPLTGIFLIAEVTSGYTLFVPLMLVSALSYSTISYFEKYSLYTKKLIEKGDLIQHDKDKIVLSLIQMQKVIEKDLLIIHPDAHLSDLVQLIQQSKRNIFPVVNDENVLVGIITLDNVRDVMFDPVSQRELIVKTLMERPPAFIDENEDMESVMNKFEITQAWNLPVLQNGKYLGFVSKSRIFNTYRQKLIRQSRE